MDKYELNCIIIKKRQIELEEVKQMIQDFIKDKKKIFYYKTKDGYRAYIFNNNKFFNTFITKVINSEISLVFGKFKKKT